MPTRSHLKPIKHIKANLSDKGGRRVVSKKLASQLDPRPVHPYIYIYISNFSMLYTVAIHKFKFQIAHVLFFNAHLLHGSFATAITIKKKLPQVPSPMTTLLF